MTNMNSFPGPGIDFKVEAAWKGLKKRSLAETEMNEYENHSGLDLELKLSPPGSSSANLPNAMKSSAFKAFVPPSASRGAYVSPMLNTEKKFGGIPKHEPPPLILMGCARCLMYVMVSKADPKCPQCKNFKLIDDFQVHPAKRLRTSRY